MKRITLLFVFFTLAKFCSAQNNQVFTWEAFQLIAKVNPKWHWVSDISYRTIGISASANQYTIRTSAKRIINDKWTTSLGVALFNSRLSVDKDVEEFDKEYRLWQEAALENKLGSKLTLMNRFRAEERFFEATSKAAAYTALRLRYRIALNQRITDKIKVQIADEYMEQLAKSKFSFQQNRTSLSGIFTLNNSTQLVGGYMLLRRPSAISQHYLILLLQKNISFKKKNNEQK